MSLIARYLEENGIATVVVGSALDIVEHCGVPRFVFTDFPLGNPCGHPWDSDMQQAVTRLALEQFENAEGPRTTVRAPYAWKDDPGWRQRYNYVGPENQAELAAIGDERRRQQASVKAKRLG